MLKNIYKNLDLVILFRIFIILNNKQIKTLFDSFLK